MTDTRVGRCRKLFVWADMFDLTREERLQLAGYLLRRDIRSFGELDDGQVARLLDAFEGHHLINTLINQRP